MIGVEYCREKMKGGFKPIVMQERKDRIHVDRGSHPFPLMSKGEIMLVKQKWKVIIRGSKMDGKIWSYRTSCFTNVFPSMIKVDIVEHYMFPLMSKGVMFRFDMYDYVWRYFETLEERLRKHDMLKFNFQKSKINL